MSIAGALGLRDSLKDAQTDQQQDRADGHIDEEDGGPAEGFDQHAAGHGACGQTDSAESGPQPDRLDPFLRHGIGGGEQGQRGGAQRRGPDALQHPSGDQPADRGRDGAQHGRDGEHRDAGQEHPLAAEAVGEDAAGQQQHGDQQHVGVDDPLQTGQLGVQPVLHIGQRRTNNRVVEQHHELPQAGHCEQRGPV